MPRAAYVLLIMLGVALIVGWGAVGAGSEPTVEATPTPFPSACAMFSGCASIPPAVESVLGAGGVLDVPPPPAAGLVEARVSRILSGDRLELDLAGRTETVTLAGIDAPVGCYSVESMTRLWALVDLGGRIVQVDEAGTLSPGEPEVFIWLQVDGQDLLLNALLAATGHALVADVAGGGHYADALERAERQAEESRAGLWGACLGRLPSQTGDG